MGKIFCLMGKSSSGKDTVYKRLRELFPDIRKITMYTTRPARRGERDGEEYWFVNEGDLAKMQRQGKVIEVRKYHTECGVWKYFTLDDGQIDLNYFDYLVIGTLQSFDSMKNYFGADKVVGIYLTVDDELRLRRAIKRELNQDAPKFEEMYRRFLSDREDFSEDKVEAARLDICVQNDRLDSCVKKIAEFICERRSWSHPDNFV